MARAAVHHSTGEAPLIVVKDLMTTTPHTLDQEATLDIARKFMKEHCVRHLPITGSDGELVGLLSLRDIVAASVSALADVDEDERDELDSLTPVAAVMSKNLIVTTPETGLRRAGEIMLSQKIGCLPVIDGDNILGIITEADFVQLSVHLLGKTVA